MEMGAGADASAKCDEGGCAIGMAGDTPAGSYTGSRSSDVEPILKAPAASFTPRHLTRVPALTPSNLGRLGGLQGFSVGQLHERAGPRLPGQSGTSATLGRDSWDGGGDEGAVVGIQPEGFVKAVSREQEEGGGARPPAPAASSRRPDVGFAPEGGQTVISEVSGADGSFSSDVIAGDTPRIGQESLDLVRNIAYAAARSDVGPAVEVSEASLRQHHHQHQPFRGHGAPSALPLFPNTAQEFLERLAMAQCDTGAPSASWPSAAPLPPPSPRSNLGYVNVEQAAPRGSVSSVNVPGASRSPRPPVHDPLRADPPAPAHRHVPPAPQTPACGCDAVEAKAAVILQVELWALYARGTALQWRARIHSSFCRVSLPPPPPFPPSHLSSLFLAPSLSYLSPSLSAQPSFFRARPHTHPHVHARDNEEPEECRRADRAGLLGRRVVFMAVYGGVDLSAVRVSFVEGDQC